MPDTRRVGTGMIWLLTGDIPWFRASERLPDCYMVIRIVWEDSQRMGPLNPHLLVLFERNRKRERDREGENWFQRLSLLQLLSPALS